MSRYLSSCICFPLFSKATEADRPVDRSGAKQKLKVRMRSVASSGATCNVFYTCSTGQVCVAGWVSISTRSRICYEESCTEMDLRYGKYCGIGHCGCPGEMTTTACID